MKKLYIIDYSENVKNSELIEVDDELYNFLNIKDNCIVKDDFQNKLFQYVLHVYSVDSKKNQSNTINDEPVTDRDLDRYASDVANGYGYYDDDGWFHYYPNYYD